MIITKDEKGNRYSIRIDDVMGGWLLELTKRQPNKKRGRVILSDYYETLEEVNNRLKKLGIVQGE